MREIPPQAARKLLHFSEGDREKILEALDRLPLNQNNLADILDLLTEISRRDRASPHALLLDGIAATKDIIDPYKKIDGLRDFLRQKRFPLYHQKRKRFDEAVKDLNLPRGVSIEPSPFFEESFVEIRSRLCSQEDLNKLIVALNSPGWTEIFKVIR